ncbi:kinase-like domain-containing protein [Dichotomocladium elegans]|nr:kinase-like domain-containing protein [Dichotomocladium elegans]
MSSENDTSISPRRDSAFASIHSVDNIKIQQRLSVPAPVTSNTDNNRKEFLPSKSTVARPSIDRDSCHPYGKADRCIGSGTSAIVTVFRNHGAPYAIKQFRPWNKSKESHRRYTKKFISEYCIASSLLHPSIVHTFDLIEDGEGNFSTVMEYCDNGDLFSAITGGNLPKVRKWDYFGQLVSGLEYLHQIGVAHRDIKPENLLLTQDGRLKISDFGVSDVFRLPWDTRCHKSFGIVGSEPYAAPEVFSNTTNGYWGAGTDVWSAGMVLYCLFSPGFCWRKAVLTDRGFYAYLCNYTSRTFAPFLSLREYDSEVGRILYLTLDPNPETRITSRDLLLDPFLASLKKSLPS